MMTLELHAQLLAQKRELNLTWQAGIRWFCCSCVLATIAASRRSNSGRNARVDVVGPVLESAPFL
jgi:hypothetical protein